MGNLLPSDMAEARSPSVETPPFEGLPAPEPAISALPDYNFWNTEACVNFPNLAVYESRVKLSGIWLHGFRLRDVRVTPNKAVWLCAICTQRKAPSPELYTYLGVNTKSIRDHMSRHHGIDIPKANVGRRPSGVEEERPRKRQRSLSISTHGQLDPILTALSQPDLSQLDPSLLDPSQTIHSQPDHGRPEIRPDHNKLMPSPKIKRQSISSPPVNSLPVGLLADSLPIPSQEEKSFFEVIASQDPNDNKQEPLSQWDEMKNQILLLDWLTQNNLPFSIVQNDQFKRLLLYNNSSLQEEQIPSAEMLIEALNAEYSRGVVSVREVLKNARSRIHYTFHGWTSQPGTPFLGVRAHFIDNQWRQWTLLLATPAQISHHTGDALADEVATTINSFEVNNSIGHFTIENTSGNDITAAALGREFEFDPGQRRINCASHFLDLVAKTMMYGTRKDDFTRLMNEWKDSNYHDEKGLQQLIDALNGVFSLGDVEEQSHDLESGDLQDDTKYPIPSGLTSVEMDKFKKSGPFGKLYNVGVHMHHSSQIRKAFLDAQIQVNTPDEPLLEFFPEDASRGWQSDESIASVASSRQRALDRMFSNIEEVWLSQGGKEEDKPSILNESLSPSEWQIVSILQRILQLFKVASSRLQGDTADTSSDGSFLDYLPVVEMLLDHLETATLGYIIEEDDDMSLVKRPLFDSINQDTRFTTLIYIKLGLKKLEEYYSRLTSAAYVGAVVFHPCKKWAVFDEIWGQSPARQNINWKCDYRKSLESLCESDYKNRSTMGKNVLDPKHDAGDIIARRLAFKRSLPGLGTQFSQDNLSSQDDQTDQTASANSELALYLSEPTIKFSVYQADPIAWWREVGSKRFPELSYMAVDFLTIPSSSTGESKGFSSGQMDASPRTRLRRHVMAMAQCIRSWAKAGIYQPTLPLGLLDSENWRETLLLTSSH